MSVLRCVFELYDAVCMSVLLEKIDWVIFLLLSGSHLFDGEEFRLGTDHTRCNSACTHFVFSCRWGCGSWIWCHQSAVCVGVKRTTIC